MSVQDDSRERELAALFSLNWASDHKRSGEDAYLDTTAARRKCRVFVEVKSTTNETVATARDFGMPHITRWRAMFFVIGFYKRNSRGSLEVTSALCLTPADLEPWLQEMEEKVQIDYKISACASRHLTMEDLHEVCGDKSAYTVADAQRVHKQQWTKPRYLQQADLKIDGEPAFSAAKMLEILRLRAKYIADRGATVNNPHIPKDFLAAFFGTHREVRKRGTNWGGAIRKVVRDFLRQNPNHRAVKPRTALAPTPARAASGGLPTPPRATGSKKKASGKGVPIAKGKKVA